MAPDLRTVERPSHDPSRSKPSEQRLLVIVGRRAVDDLVDVVLDGAPVGAHGGSARPDRERRAGRERSEPTSDPADDASLMVRELLRPLALQPLTEQDPGGDDQCETAHQELEIDRTTDRDVGQLRRDDLVEPSKAARERSTAERRRDQRLDDGPCFVRQREDVLAHPHPHREPHRRRAGPRSRVGHEEVACHLGIGDDVHRRRPEPQPATGPSSAAASRNRSRSAPKACSDRRSERSIRSVGTPAMGAPRKASACFVACPHGRSNP